MFYDEVEVLPKRKQNRLKGFDYSTNGAYFITICTHNRKCILSSVGAIHESPENAFTKLTAYGNIAEKHINALEGRFNLIIPVYSIMPNHIHMIIMVDNQRAIRESPLQNNRSVLSKAIGYLKMNTSKEIHNYCDIEVWQRGYYDHIIRNEKDLNDIWQYIDENPKKWLLGKDEYYA